MKFTMIKSHALFSFLATAFIITQSAVAQTWQFLGLGTETIKAIAFDPKNINILYVSGFSGETRGALFKSTNAGASWDTLFTDLPVGEIGIHPNHTETIFITVPEKNILKSHDGGMTWVRSDSGIGAPHESGASSLVINPKYPEIMYAGTAGLFGGSIFKSIDGGRSWFCPGLINDQSILTILIDPQHPDTVYAGTSGFGGVFMSKDGGATWDSTLWNVGLVVSLASRPDSTNYIFAGVSRRGIFKTTNFGQIWVSRDTTASSRAIIVNPINSYEVFFTSKKKVVRSIDAVETWNDLISDSTNFGMQVLGIDANGRRLYGSKKLGLYRFDLITSVVNHNSVPPSFQLYQNYPNPFNAMSKIRFSLSHSGHVFLEIYNLVGRKIQTLVEDWKDAGEHEITFSALNLSSGVYFYRLQAEDRVQIRKLILLR